jgi:hypothetical protein
MVLIHGLPLPPDCDGLRGADRGSDAPVDHPGLRPRRFESNRSHVERTQSINQKENPEDDPDDLQRLAFDKHAHDVIDDVEDESGNEERDER